jgi:hypothetical protein
MNSYPNVVDVYPNCPKNKTLHDLEQNDMWDEQYIMKFGWFLMDELNFV